MVKALFHHKEIIILNVYIYLIIELQNTRNQNQQNYKNKQIHNYSWLFIFLNNWQNEFIEN